MLTICTWQNSNPRPHDEKLIVTMIQIIGKFTDKKPPYRTLAMYSHESAKNIECPGMA